MKIKFKIKPIGEKNIDEVYELLASKIKDYIEGWEEKWFDYNIGDNHIEIIHTTGNKWRIEKSNSSVFLVYEGSRDGFHARTPFNANIRFEYFDNRIEIYYNDELVAEGMIVEYHSSNPRLKWFETVLPIDRPSTLPSIAFVSDEIIYRLRIIEYERVYDKYSVAMQPYKIVLLNSAIAFPGFITYAKKISIEEARRILKNAVAVESYIGHQATAQLVNMLFDLNIQASRAMFEPSEDFNAIVFRLKKRLEKPEDVSNISADDVEILLLRGWKLDKVVYTY